MRFTMMAGMLISAGLLTISTRALIQDPGVPTQVYDGLAWGGLATGGLISSLLAAPVSGQPFTAVQVHSTLRVLADGSTVSHKGHHAIARDAEGRVHVELRMARGREGKPDEAMVFVMDPVAHTLTTWLANAPVKNNVASVFKLPTQGLSAQGSPSQSAPAQPPVSPAEGRPQRTITVKDLGIASIQGLEASGQETTTVLPAGREGNSAPITTVHDVWTSAELQLVIKQHWTDPRSGEKTVELEHLSRANPDVALFQPPSGYQVKSAGETLKALEEKLSAPQQ